MVTIFLQRAQNDNGCKVYFTTVKPFSRWIGLSHSHMKDKFVSYKYRLGFFLVSFFRICLCSFYSFIFTLTRLSTVIRLFCCHGRAPLDQVTFAHVFAWQMIYNRLWKYMSPLYACVQCFNRFVVLFIFSYSLWKNVFDIRYCSQQLKICINILFDMTVCHLSSMQVWICWLSLRAYTHTKWICTLKWLLNVIKILILKWVIRFAFVRCLSFALSPTNCSRKCSLWCEHSSFFIKNNVNGHSLC